MFPRARLQSYLSKGFLAPYVRVRHYHSPEEMRFRIYPRSFPVAMLNIMNYGQRILKERDFEDCLTHNVARIESDGLIDPYLATCADLTDPGEGSVSWT